MVSESEIDAARHAMVDTLVQRRIITTAAVERAFRRMPRHAFVLPPYAVSTDVLASDFAITHDPRRVYTDAVVAVNRRRQIYSVAPSVGALLAEQLGISDGMRVLHAGTTDGYYTCILAELVGDGGTVVAVESDEEDAEWTAACVARAGYPTVTIRAGDGALGVPEAAPFDRILVSAGAADIAPAWIEQLTDDGRLVVPLTAASAGPAITAGMVLTVAKAGDELFGALAGRVFTPPLLGALAPTPEEASAVADGLMRWSALEEFLRTDLSVRVVMKAMTAAVPRSESVPWLLETRNAVLWGVPN